MGTLPRSTAGHPQVTCPGWIMPKRRETSALDVDSRAILRYQADPNWATRIDRSTQRWKVCLSPQPQEGVSTSQADAPDSESWVHLRTLLSLFHFPDGERPFPLFLFLTHPLHTHTGPRRLLLFPPPSVSSRSLPSSVSLSVSLFPFKSHPPCNQQQKLT